MSMKIGIIGAENSLRAIRQTLSHLPQLDEFTYLTTRSYTDAPEILKKHQSEFDAILFSGTSPYHYAMNFVKPEIPWEYLPRNPISFLCVLLKASHLNGLDITKISVDSYQEKRILDAYAEINYTKKDLTLCIADYDVMKPDYVESLLQFHIYNYKNKSVSFCITGLDSIYTRLTEMGIPCEKINPSSEVILQQIQKLQLQHQMKLQSDNMIATIAVEFTLFEHSPLYGINLLSDFHSRNAAREKVYIFAQRLNAALFEVSDSRFLLFTTKNEIERDTRNYKSMDLFRQLGSCENVDHVFIGIGLGSTARDSKLNAELGAQKAHADQNDCMYIVYEDRRIAGPVFPGTSGKYSLSAPVVNKKLFAVSRDTGIGIGTLQQIDAVLRENSLDTTTSRQLADLMGLSVRNMNRILSHLEEHGYLTVIGVESHSGAGRPSRLIRFRW